MPYKRFVVDVSAQATYPTTPQVDLSGLFVPRGYFAVVTSGNNDGVVLASFDGASGPDSIKLVEGKPIGNGQVPLPAAGQQRMWLKKSAGTNPVTVEIVAYTDDR